MTRPDRSNQIRQWITYLVGIGVVVHETVVASEPRWALFPLVAGMIGLGEFVPFLSGVLGKRNDADGNGGTPPAAKKPTKGRSMFAANWRYA